MKDSTYAGGLGAARPQPAERTIRILRNTVDTGGRTPLLAILVDNGEQLYSVIFMI